MPRAEGGRGRAEGPPPIWEQKGPSGSPQAESRDRSPAFKAAQTSSSDAAKSPPSCRAIPAQLGGGGDAGRGPSVPVSIPVARSPPRPPGTVRLPLHGCLRGLGGGSCSAPHRQRTGSGGGLLLFSMGGSVDKREGGAESLRGGGQAADGGHPRGASAECSPLGWGGRKPEPPLPLPSPQCCTESWDGGRGVRVLGGGNTKKAGEERAERPWEMRAG